MSFLLDPVEKPLERWLASRGVPKYRLGQIHNWLFARRAASFEEMTDLPQDLRKALSEELPLWSTNIVKRHRADDATEKLLLELADGQRIECVLMREGQRRTICISTQVGCGMGCAFCASGLEGVTRNLSSGEIVEQMLRLNQCLGPNERISHIVVMGMGEPLANLKSLLPALELATSPQGLGISARRITVSTVGLPAGIDRLAKNNVPYRLAVSLHAPNDELRDQLVRVNSKIGIDAILSAAARYFAATGRRLTFEYVLLADVNDQPEHAQELVRRLAGRTALVNIIPYNPVDGLPYHRPSDEALNRFVAILRGAEIEVQVRKRKGDAIDAACGQLRRSMGNTQTVFQLPSVDVSSSA
ncbi:Probable dual-specificity RNA methyltransferase RlmN (23S rRNA (adenine(2503)-C(2))-methyltransferase) (23S rRNA m2A2503 methyltransferase) (Ribosomal RNA large subunit methyltransferase N) (tRNA (adenine(37)-C(2))-methyltransferase) (tRNA m2A37 methyltransferase) [Durusdinium trenchii]|uniref:Radical SAM core domain-containing protein n=1 Tax=Durusdinium trenchii TaxID=1381693 RepID=A0ABP0P1E8_9DINO